MEINKEFYYLNVVGAVVADCLQLILLARLVVLAVALVLVVVVVVVVVGVLGRWKQLLERGLLDLGLHDGHLLNILLVAGAIATRR
jgi:hypothetical protein